MIKETAVLLDGRRFLNRQAAHDVLSTALALPAHYGRNLDALYDCLTDACRRYVVLYYQDALVKNLGEYGEALLQVLKDANAYGGTFHIEIM